tara:strand:- start:46055 stop:46249 length:195 start_codon:yes stop_codon:yes gene_type:complete
MNSQVKKIFKEIENLRAKNNKNWMNLLRLSFEIDPKKTIKIIQNILSKDEKLIKLANKLKKYSK